MVDLNDKRVAICLSSGFFGFYAHCGFMQAVTSLGISPIAITGCSAGALLGALWASGLPEDGIRRTILKTSLSNLVDIPSLKALMERPFGLARGRRMERALSEALPISSFEECPIPFAVTTFDLNEGALRIIDSGPLAPAVRASASLPGMFGPAEIDGHLCWDGAVAEKAPIRPLLKRNDFDVIVVCYLARPDPTGPPRSLMAGIRRALDALVYDSDRRTVAEAREGGAEILVVAPVVTRCGPHKLSQGGTIIDQAERETLRIFREEDFGCEELS